MPLGKEELLKARTDLQRQLDRLVGGIQTIDQLIVFMDKQEKKDGTEEAKREVSQEAGQEG